MANVVFDAYTFAATGSSALRTMPDRLSDVINVKDYGATGDGVTGDTVAIQAAINAALLQGDTSLANNFGAIVFFPPGAYLSTAALTFGAGNASVSLVGSGRRCTRIQGTFAGYIIDKPDNGLQNLDGIEGLTITNASTSASAGAVRYCVAERGMIQACSLNGYNALVADQNAFCAAAYNCDFNPGLGDVNSSASRGAMVAQFSFYQCSFTGFTEGVRAYNVGVVISGCRFENNETAILVGKDTGGATNQLGGFTITGNSFERNTTCIDLWSGSGGIVAGNALTGTIGPPHNIASMSWSSASSGVATCNSVYATGLSSGNLISIENVTSTGPGSFNVTDIACNVVDADTFTYPLATNPGSVTVQGTWSRNCLYGIRARGLTATTIAGNTVSVQAETASVDLTYDGNTSGTNNTFVGNTTTGSSTWIMPVNISKASFKYIENDNPAATMNYADLPGQAGVYMTPAIEGMEYDIINSNSSVWGATASGGGTTHAKVRYNGTNWTVVGA